MTALAVVLLGVALAAFAFTPLWPGVLIIVGTAALVAALALAAVEALSPTACDCPCRDADGDQDADDEPVGPHVEVHASTDPEFTPGPDTLVGHVELLSVDDERTVLSYDGNTAVVTRDGLRWHAPPSAWFDDDGRYADRA